MKCLNISPGFYHTNWDEQWDSGLRSRSQNLTPPMRIPCAPAPCRDASQLQPTSQGWHPGRAALLLELCFSRQCWDSRFKELLGQTCEVKSWQALTWGSRFASLGGEGRKEGHLCLDQVTMTFAGELQFERVGEKIQRCSGSTPCIPCSWYMEGKAKLVLPPALPESLWNF